MSGARQERRPQQSRPHQWLPEVGTSLDLCALGRSGESICAKSAGNGARVLVRNVAFFDQPVEGELFTLDVSRRSRDWHLWLLEGKVHSARLEVESLAVTPLDLLERESAAESADGREGYELETVLPRVPGLSTTGRTCVAEIEAFAAAGDRELARMLAGEVLAREIRCLEAHAILGDLFRDGPLAERWTERALRHYSAGAAIGDLSVGEDFSGRLPWRWPGNRSYLRCLYWRARCLERIGDLDASRAALDRLIDLCPEDPFAVRQVS